MQQDPSQANSPDLLSLNDQKSFATILNDKEHIVMSTNILKYNRHGKCQERILVLTNQAILNILKKSNILKSFFKKIVNFEDKFQIKRRIPLSSLYGLTITLDRKENMFLLHVIDDHDYYYHCDNNKMLILKCISQEYRKMMKKELPFFFKDSLVILNYCTFKNHLKDKKDLKPKDQPYYLNQSYFDQKDFQDTEYIPECLFETDQNMQVRPKNFHRVDINQLKSESTYFVVKEQGERSIHLPSLIKHPRVLKPWFSFFNQKKQLMFVPFVNGGCLQDYIKKHLPLQRQTLMFYLGQLIVILQQVEAEGKLYANLSLQNIFVERNGYLVLNGLERGVYDLKTNQEDNKFFKILGNPYYFPPQVITFDGFSQQIVVWKLGVICYYLLTGKYPFVGKNLKDLYFNIMTRDVDDEDLPDFIITMLQKDKKKRITLSQLKKIPDLAGMNWSALQAEKMQAPFPVSIQQKCGKMPIIYELRLLKEEEVSVKRTFSV